MSFVLVKYSRSIGDEFEADGFGIFKLSEWDRLCRKTEEVFDDIAGQEISVGTNTPPSTRSRNG
jgi:hypothetical protein